MSQATALSEAQGLKAALLLHGVPEVSIELQPGRPNSSGDLWNSQFVVCDFSHHTVSRYSSTNRTPCLGIIKRGRGKELSGPLANGYGGWDLCFRIITLGYANHPGEGGPIRVAGGYTIPKDSARRYAFGVEYEGGLNEADWDREITNPRNSKHMTFREFMGRCNAGIQSYYHLPMAAHLEHKTWAPNRKIDRLGYSQSEGIVEISRYLKTTPPTPGKDGRIRNSKGQLAMSFRAIQVSLEQEVSDTYAAYRNTAWGTLVALGVTPKPTRMNKTEFRAAWNRFVKAVHASSNAYAFEYMVDRAGYWPPDNNDWPSNARDR